MKKIVSFLIAFTLLVLNVNCVSAEERELHAPEGLRVIAKSSTAVTLMWDPVEKFDTFGGYNIYDGGKLVASSIIEGSNGIKNYHVLSGLEPGSVHVYRVAVYDTRGNVSRAGMPVIVKTSSGFERENIAHGKKVSASSEVSADYNVRRIVDGTTGSLRLPSGGEQRNIWRSSRKNTSEWVMIDLGKSTYIDEIVIKHIGVTATTLDLQNLKDYTIYASNDKEQWDTLFDVKDNTAKETSYTLKESKLYRFIKILITGYNRATGNDALCADISEVEVYNDITKIPTEEELSAISYMDIPEIGYSIPRRNPPAIANAVFADSAVTIDAKAEEEIWKKAEVYTVKKPLEADSEAQVTFRTAWDLKNLYVFVDVKDANIFADSKNIWDDDSIEIYIDALCNRTAKFEKDDAQLSINTKNEMRYNIGGTVAYEPGSDSGVKHAVMITDDGWTLEAAIPMSIFGTAIVQGKPIGFSIGYNDDNDGGSRDGHIIWEGYANSSTSTERYGTLNFVK